MREFVRPPETDGTAQWFSLHPRAWCKDPIQTLIRFAWYDLAVC